MKRTVHSKHKDYFVLLCDDNHFSPKEKWREPLICGVLASYKEAKELKEAVEGCVCHHIIKRCKITIKYEGK